MFHFREPNDPKMDGKEIRLCMKRPYGSGANWRRREMPTRASRRVLEVRIGTGENSLCYPPGVSLVGADIAGKMLRPARERALKMKLPVQLMAADVQDPDFRDDSSDTVVSPFVFCSVPDSVRDGGNWGGSSGRADPSSGTPPQRPAEDRDADRIFQPPRRSTPRTEYRKPFDAGDDRAGGFSSGEH